FIVPVRHINPRNPLTNIPLTVNDGAVKDNFCYAICEQIEKVDESKDENIFFNNVTNNTLEKIMEMI
ncbi:MAG: hypothetical protein PHI87_05705, partial [Candidatus Methanomethylophilus sp.]|nr:hypothetical protein [Methanomethylophilus sp.]